MMLRKVPKKAKEEVVTRRDGWCQLWPWEEGEGRGEQVPKMVGLYREEQSHCHPTPDWRV